METKNKQKHEKYWQKKKEIRIAPPRFDENETDEDTPEGQSVNNDTRIKQYTKIWPWEFEWRWPFEWQRPKFGFIKPFTNGQILLLLLTTVCTLKILILQNINTNKIIQNHTIFTADFNRFYNCYSIFN